MTDTPETIPGTGTEVPPEVEAEATQALERVERAGMLPSVPEGRSLSYAEAIQLGHVLAELGYFSDAKTAAQCAVQVMTGAELGFAPMASIMGIHIIEGRPSLGGRLLGAVVKRDPHFNFTIEQLDDVERNEAGHPVKGKCVLVFTEDGVALEPKAEFTIEDAYNAKLIKTDKAKSGWMTYPKKMLYWRALSWGVDFHCPHLVGGLPLVATEDAEAEIANGDDRPALVAELHPPAARPAPLDDDKAHALRRRAKAAHDELREINPAVFPGARFSNSLANKEHSHEALEAFAESMEELRDTEQAIIDAVDKLGELAQADAKVAVEINTAIERAMAIREGGRSAIRDALETEVNNRLDAEAVESDEGKGE